MQTNKSFFFDYKQLTLSSFISFFLGLSIISSIPYSNGIAKDWFITIAEGYRISFFYAFEIILYGSALFVFGLKFKSKREKMLFVSITVVLLSRVISLLFADRYDKVQVISFFRYIEVFLTIYVLANLLEKKVNRSTFLAGLILGVLFECVFGFSKYFLSDGAQRGIAVGIHSFQLMIFLLFAIIILFDLKRWGTFILFATILVLGILANGTRGAFLQIALGVVFLIMFRKATRFRELVPMVLISIGILVGFFYLFQHFFTGNRRMNEVIGVINRFDDRKQDDKLESEAEIGTIQYRFYLWDKSLGAFFSKPITGIGSGGFGRQLESLPQVFDVTFDRTDKNTPLSSHNTFLGVLAETGLVGLLAYLFWAYAIISIILSSINSAAGNAFTLSAVIMLAVFIVSDLWSQNSFLPNMSFILGFILGFLREQDVTSEPATVT